MPASMIGCSILRSSVSLVFKFPPLVNIVTLRPSRFRERRPSTLGEQGFITAGRSGSVAFDHAARRHFGRCSPQTRPLGDDVVGHTDCDLWHKASDENVRYRQGSV